MRTIKTLVLLLSISACASVPEIQNPFVVEETPIYHPPLPEPYKVCPLEWDVSKEDARVSTTWGENVTAEKCSEDLLRYLKQLKNVACSYRKALQEPECSISEDIDEKQ